MEFGGFTHRSWAEIDLDCLVHNYKLSRSMAKSPVYCVIKADAYGHGAPQAAAALKDAGCTNFAVATAEEALQLRRHGIDDEILILGMCDPLVVPELADLNITIAVGDLDTARQYAKKLYGRKLDVHLKLDTGMNRIGLSCNLIDAIAVAKIPELNVTGVFSHLCTADDPGEDEFTVEQIDRFRSAVAELEKAGVHKLVRHLGNSAGIVAHNKSRWDMARPGIILYGSNPTSCEAGFLPVMSVYSRIVQVKTVKKGETVGYGRGWTAPFDSVIATVPIGYADGIHRRLSGVMSAVVNSVRVRQVGRICMDMLMLDVTGVPGVTAGDVVTVIGCDGEETITADEIAGLCGTISYEIFCALGRRIPRLYFKGGEIVDAICYIDKL